MIYLKPKHYKGLDCSSSKSAVLPPTFKGVRALVNQVGESAAMAAFPLVDDDDSSSPEKSIVEEFLSELRYADKVERQTLVRDFGKFVEDLKASQPSAPSGKPEGDKEGADAIAKATTAEPEGEPAGTGAK